MHGEANIFTKSPPTINQTQSPRLRGQLAHTYPFPQFTSQSGPSKRLADWHFGHRLRQPYHQVSGGAAVWQAMVHLGAVHRGRHDILTGSRVRRGRRINAKQTGLYRCMARHQPVLLTGHYYSPRPAGTETAATRLWSRPKHVPVVYGTLDAMPPVK